MASNHIKNLERALAALRLTRRKRAEKDGFDENDLAELGELQRDFEAIERAIEDERKQELEEEVDRSRLANRPKRDRYRPEADD
jgi:hypothetical protein